jgi:putative transposase
VPSVVKMCRWMEVSRSGFYEWRGAPESATAKRREDLGLIITKSFDGVHSRGLDLMLLSVA